MKNSGFCTVCLVFFFSPALSRKEGKIEMLALCFHFLVDSNFMSLLWKGKRKFLLLWAGVDWIQMCSKIVLCMFSVFRSPPCSWSVRKPLSIRADSPGCWRIEIYLKPGSKHHDEQFMRYIRCDTAKQKYTPKVRNYNWPKDSSLN